MCEKLLVAYNLLEAGGGRGRGRRGSSFGPDERGRGWLRAKQERCEPYILIRRVRVLVAQKEVVDRVGVTLLLANGALLAPCRRWIGKCKWARPQNECRYMGTRIIEPPILLLRAARRFFGVPI